MASSALLPDLCHLSAPSIRPLSRRSELIFDAICEVFESYLLTCFILFSGISLEMLVFRVRILGCE